MGESEWGSRSENLRSEHRDRNVRDGKDYVVGERVWWVTRMGSETRFLLFDSGLYKHDKILVLEDVQ